MGPHGRPKDKSSGECEELTLREPLLFSRGLTIKQPVIEVFAMQPWIFIAPIALAAVFTSVLTFATTISVEGRGLVDIAPEYATLSASVSQTAERAADAQVAVDNATTSLLDGIETLPIEANTLNAAQIRIQPRYRWDPRTESQEFLGYEVVRDLSFRLSDLEQLGKALQLLTQRGATMVSEPRAGSFRAEAARARALAKAFEAARADVAALARAAGATLAEPVTINTGSRPAPVFRPATRATPATLAAEAPPRYEPGQLMVLATVSVVFNVQ